jgi:hypothetical protein
MKTTILKQHAIFLLLSPLCVALLGAGCDEDKDEYSDRVEGYVVGSFVGDEVNAEGVAAGNKTPRGYCILLKGNGEKNMDFYTFNFPDTLFAFPDKILTPNYNGNDCGPTFFPDSLKYAYKIKFKYQIVDEPDNVRFATGPCSFWLATFPWEDFNQVIVAETTKD